MSVFVQPRRGACPLNWTEWRAELIFGVGTGGCRWELFGELSEIHFLEAVVEAAIAGRISEVFWPARSRVTV